MSRRKHNSIEVGDVEVMIVQNSRTEFDKDEVLKWISIDEAVEHDILKLNNTAIKRYFEEHPEAYVEYEKLMFIKQGPHGEKQYNKAFLALRKNRKGD